MQNLGKRYQSLFQTNINIEELKKNNKTYLDGRNSILIEIIKGELKRDYNYTDSELNTLLSGAKDNQAKVNILEKEQRNVKEDLEKLLEDELAKKYLKKYLEKNKGSTKTLNILFNENKHNSNNVKYFLLYSEYSDKIDNKKSRELLLKDFDTIESAITSLTDTLNNHEDMKTAFYNNSSKFTDLLIRNGTHKDDIDKEIKSLMNQFSKEGTASRCVEKAEEFLTNKLKKKEFFEMKLQTLNRLREETGLNGYDEDKYKNKDLDVAIKEIESEINNIKEKQKREQQTSLNRVGYNTGSYIGSSGGGYRVGNRYVPPTQQQTSPSIMTNPQNIVQKPFQNGIMSLMEKANPGVSLRRLWLTQNNVKGESAKPQTASQVSQQMNQFSFQPISDVQPLQPISEIPQVQIPQQQIQPMQQVQIPQQQIQPSQQVQSVPKFKPILKQTNRPAFVKKQEPLRITKQLVPHYSVEEKENNKTFSPIQKPMSEFIKPYTASRLPNNTKRKNLPLRFRSEQARSTTTSINKQMKEEEEKSKHKVNKFDKPKPLRITNPSSEVQVVELKTEEDIPKPKDDVNFHGDDTELKVNTFRKDSKYDRKPLRFKKKE